MGNMAFVAGIVAPKANGSDLALIGLEQASLETIAFPVSIGNTGVGFGYIGAGGKTLIFTLSNGAGTSCRFFVGIPLA